MLFYVNSHGDENQIMIGGANNYLTINHLSGNSAPELSNIRFLLLLTCKSSNGYHYSHIQNNTPVNIAESFYLCGAQVVVGFPTILSEADCNIFAEDFSANAMLLGKTILNAIASVDCTNFMCNMSQLADIIGDGTNKLDW